MQSIRYIDFNNNTYSLTATTISYRPIRPEQSSSGTYSGGEPKSGIINEMMFQKAVGISKKIQNEEKLHLNERRMLTAMLYLKQGDESTRLIIGRSKLQQELVATLQAILQEL